MAAKKKKAVMSLTGPQYPTAEKALDLIQTPRPATAISIKDAPRVAEQFVDAEKTGNHIRRHPDAVIGHCYLDHTGIFTSRDHDPSARWRKFNRIRHQVP